MTPASASGADVAQAETQLDTAKGQLIDLGVARAQYRARHRDPDRQAPVGIDDSEQQPLKAEPPKVPIALPSTLLERRPDIAASERQMAALNEQVGIAEAAYYPQVTLGGGIGLANSAFTQPVHLGRTILDRKRQPVRDVVRRRPAPGPSECRQGQFRRWNGHLSSDRVDRVSASRR